MAEREPRNIIDLDALSQTELGELATVISVHGLGLRMQEAGLFCAFGAKPFGEADHAVDMVRLHRARFVARYAIDEGPVYLGPLALMQPNGTFIERYDALVGAGLWIPQRNPVEKDIDPEELDDCQDVLPPDMATLPFPRVA